MNIDIGKSKIEFQKSCNDSLSEITVIISLFNYEKFICDCLQSVYVQTEKHIDLIIVDDCSSDNSLAVVKVWLEKNSNRFNNVLLLHHIINRGLSITRNTAIHYSTTPHIFILDADNILLPRCLMRLKNALEYNKGASFAYNIILAESDKNKSLMCYQTWNRELLSNGNYIDAMSLIRREVLIDLGGYSKEMNTGWEDYDLWCKIAESDGYGILIPEILSVYRIHGDSMLRKVTHSSDQKTKDLIKKITDRHPWLNINFK